jgi:hypothetical protein
MAVSRSALCVALALLAIASVLSSGTEAAKIETWNGPNCGDGGPATNTFFVGGNTCQTFFDEGSVRVSEIDANTRVSVHNQKNCETYSSVGQFYGPGCLTQGATKLRAVWIQG